ncbi:MAG: putative lipid II flippase FtsW [Acidimicrobiales bacterium]|nr:putative lipid II flippase FtsW [Acidimicrobiales bacterium]
MTTTIGHPALRGRTVPRSFTHRFAVPGVSTTRFWILASIVTVLNMVGTLMVISSSSVASAELTGGASPWLFAKRQLMFTGIGMIALVVMLFVSVRFWRRVAYPLFLVSLLPLVAVAVPGLGSSKNGAARWLDIGPIQFQPSELVKLTLLLAVADVLARRERRLDDWRESLVPVLIPLVVVCGLIMAQPNLGTTIIIAVTIMTMVWVAGVRMKPLAAVGGIGALFAAGFVVLEPFRLRRFLSFLDPRGDLDGAGYQTGQAMIGFANGGLIGRGLGRSTVKWGYLPYAFNDFIFAVVGEELGLAGAMFVVVAFLAFILVGTSIAMSSDDPDRDRFPLLVAVGVTAWLGVQAIMNMAVVTGAMPLTGVPLPFISFGGSAQIVNLAAVGLLLNVARHPAAAPSKPLGRRLHSVGGTGTARRKGSS